MMCGAVIGLGLWVAIFPQRLRQIFSGVKRGTRQSQTWMNKRTSERHRADLAIMNRVAADMVVRKLLSGLLGFAVVVILLALGAEVGVAVPFAAAMIIGALAAIAGFIMPDQMLRTAATSRRRNFLHAFSSYLDLTNVLLAGGAGTETALVAAADAGDGWALDEVRHALVRARSGGTGARFNLGEMSVTRCAVTMGEGVVGVAYVQGRSQRHAEQAAVADALLQLPEWHDTVQAQLIQPLARLHAERVERQARVAAQTKVEFFTMVRGED